MYHTYKTWRPLGRRQDAESKFSNSAFIQQSLRIFLKDSAQAPVPLYEFEQEECRTAKKLTSWQFLTIRLLVSSAHNYSWGIPNKPSRSRQDLLRDR